MFCTNCGKEIDDNWKFCQNCGYQIKHDAEIKIVQTNEDEEANDIIKNNIKTVDDDRVNDGETKDVQTNEDEFKKDVEENNYYKSDKVSKINSFNKIPLIFLIITLIVVIINYFIEIDILYHMEYGDVKDFFLVVFNAIIIAIPCIVTSIIMAIVIKVLDRLNFDNLTKKTTLGIFILFGMLIVLNYDYDYNYFGNNYKSNDEIVKNNSVEQIEETSSYNATSDSEYCEAYGCARKKTAGSSTYCSIHLEDPTAQTPVAKPKSSSSSSTYSKYHKCEYVGCTNYASEAKYCSKHNQTKCYKNGCNNVEAYVGAGICIEHLTDALNY